MSDEMFLCPQKGQTTFTDLEHLYCWFDKQLSIKDRTYSAAVRSLLIYGSETCSTRTDT